MIANSTGTAVSTALSTALCAGYPPGSLACECNALSSGGCVQGCSCFRLIDIARMLRRSCACRYYAALVELGAGLPVDLQHLDDGDLDQLGMRKLEKNRLHKALQGV